MAARVPSRSVSARKPSTNTTVTVLSIDSERGKIQQADFEGAYNEARGVYLGTTGKILGVEGTAGRESLCESIYWSYELYNPVTRRFEVDGETVDTEATNAESFTQILQIRLVRL